MLRVQHGPLRVLLARPVLLLPLPPFLWASNIVLGRALGGTFPPVTLAEGRWLVAFVALLPFVMGRLRAQAPLLRQHWSLVFASGAFGIAGYSALGYTALRTITAAEAAFLNSALPLVVPVLAWALLGERVGPRRWLGILVSFGGVAWIISRGHPVALAAGLTASRGALLTLLGVGNYALYSVLLRRRPATLDPFVFLAVSIAAGLLVLAPFWAWELARGARVPIDAASLAVVLYTGLFVSLLAYAAWNHCVFTLGAVATGISYHLIAVFTPLLAYAALGEHLEVFHLVGIGLILTGFALATIIIRPTAARSKLRAGPGRHDGRDEAGQFQRPESLASGQASGSSRTLGAARKGSVEPHSWS